MECLYIKCYCSKRKNTNIRRKADIEEKKYRLILGENDLYFITNSRLEKEEKNEKE